MPSHRILPLEKTDLVPIKLGVWRMTGQRVFALWSFEYLIHSALLFTQFDLLLYAAVSCMYLNWSFYCQYLNWSFYCWFYVVCSAIISMGGSTSTRFTKALKRKQPDQQQQPSSFASSVLPGLQQQHKCKNKQFGLIKTIQGSLWKITFIWLKIVFIAL